MYSQEISEAFERTRAFNIALPESFDPQYEFDRLLNDEALESIKYEIYNVFGYLTPSSVCGKCFDVHYKMLGPISRLFDKAVLLTFGYLKIGNKTVYKRTNTELDMMFKNGVDYDDIGLHAWLTLPTYEIIDITFKTTLAIVKNQDEGLGAMIFGKADMLMTHIEYHPLLVGESVLERLNIDVNY